MSARSPRPATPFFVLPEDACRIRAYGRCFDDEGDDHSGERDEFAGT